MANYFVEKRSVFITKWSPRRPVLNMTVDATINEVTGKIVAIEFEDPRTFEGKRQKLGPSAFFTSRTEAIDHVVKIKQQRIKQLEIELQRLKNERIRITNI